MTKIGSHQHVVTYTFLVNEGEDLWIDFGHDGGDYRVRVIFMHGVDPDEKGILQRSVKVTGMEDHAVVTFVNWNSPTAQTTREPISFASPEDNAHSIYFLATVSKHDKTHTLTIQFTAGEYRP